MNIIVDVQGFKTYDNEFIIKEIAILYNNQIQVLLFKPPFPFYYLSKIERRTVSWIEKNRGISWNDGIIPYSDYKNIVINLLKDGRIFTKGSEKVSWLKNISGNKNVFNLEEKGCPNLITVCEQFSSENDVFKCIYHSSVCALKNVMSLNKWCLKNNIFFKT